MGINFSKIMTDRNLMMILKTPHEFPIGALGLGYDINLKLNEDEVSELTFTYSKYDNLMPIAHYDDIEIGAVIEAIGIAQFVIEDVLVNGEGSSEVKNVTCKSLEYELDTRRVVIPSGTYRLCDILEGAASATKQTVLGMALEKFPHWSVSKNMSIDLLTKYRTFEDVDENVLTFLRGTVQELYNCLFEFDTLTHTISVIDLNDDLAMAPIYLSLDNVIKNLSYTTNLDGYCTSYIAQGADGVDIRPVNPIAEDAVYNLGYPISIGRIPPELASRWNDWQTLIRTNQPVFKNRVALRSMAYTQYLNEKVKLTELRGERSDLENQRSVVIQAIASPSFSDDVESLGKVRDRLTSLINEKDAEIKTQEDAAAAMNEAYEASDKAVQEVTSQLRKETFFTQAEMEILNRYIYEGSMQDPSFAVYDVDVSGENDSYFDMSGSTITLKDITVVDVGLNSSNEKIYDISGGNITISGAKNVVSWKDGYQVNTPKNYRITGQLNNATIDAKSDGSLLMSIYLGYGAIDTSPFASANITLTCTSSSLGASWLNAFTVVHIPHKDSNGNVLMTETKYTGNNTISDMAGNLYFTRNATEYQRYSVEQALYDYAVEKLDEVAYPIYEFEIDSCNIIFIKEFEPFKNALRLGHSIYLRIADGENGVIRPRLLGVEFAFDESSSLTLTFANSFRRTQSGYRALNDKLRDVSSSTRKSILNQFKNGAYENSGAENLVKDFLEDGRLAAQLTVMAPNGGKTTFGDAGLISIDQTGKYQLIINNGMMALIDNATGKAELGIGHFYNPATGTDWTGVNAKILGGDMILGQYLILHTSIPGKETQTFTIDQNGVVLKNGRFYLENNTGGKILIDPSYGIVAGTKDLFTVDENGNLTQSFLTGGKPNENANFLLDIKNGSAFFRGIIEASGGHIGGFTILDGELYSGDNSIYGQQNYVGINGDSYDSAEPRSAYAFWAGNKNPGSAPFWVTKKGEMSAKNATFDGATINDATIKNAKITGTLTTPITLDGTLDAKENSWITGVGIRVGGDYKTGNGNFYVDQNGNVITKGSLTIDGDFILNGSGKITWANLTDDTQDKITDAKDTADNAQKSIDDLSFEYNGVTCIDSTSIRTSYIIASDVSSGKIHILDRNENTAGSITVKGAQSYNGTKLVLKSGALDFQADYGDLYLESNNNASHLHLQDGYVRCYGDFIPTSPGNTDLGTSDANWGTVYANDCAACTSDRTKKRDIETLPQKYLNFLDSIQPVRYVLRNGRSGRYHVGFIAQDIENSMSEFGISTQEFGGFIKDKDEDGNDIYMLRYEEFIGILLAKIQQLDKKIKEICSQAEN